jgi:hypothetical protein
MSYHLVGHAAHAFLAGLDDPHNLDRPPVGFFHDKLIEHGDQVQQGSECRGADMIELASAKPTIQDLPEVRSAFAEKRRTLRLLEVGSSSELHLMVRRRICFVDEILSQSRPEIGRKRIRRP